MGPLSGDDRWRVDQGDAAAWLRQLPDGYASLVLTSPPYEDARTYSVGFRHKRQAWVDWLRPIVAEACRVSAGLVCVNMAAKVEDHSYSAAVEWLVTDLTRLDGLVCGPSPFAWVKSEGYDDADGNGTPGSGGTRYQRRDWEPVYAFCLPDRLPLAWTNNTAYGKPPKYGPGGEYAARGQNGVRQNDPWKTASRGGGGTGGRRANGGKKKGPKYRTVRGHDKEGRPIPGYGTHPKIANPGNVVRVPVGGGKLGCRVAHDGEAPMSLGVAERFVCWYCPPDGVVIDPFAGTGTTGHAALNHGRRFLGCDLRASQAKLATGRLSGVTPPIFAGV